MPVVWIVVLNHHGRTHTIECLKSVARLTYTRTALVLIDNGCADFAPDEVTALFAGAEYRRTETNLGFTGGANLGLRTALGAGADYILLLNNDATVEPQTLTELLRVARSDAAIGIVGAKLLRMDMPQVLECAGLRVDLSWGRVYQIGFGERDNGQYDATADVAAVSGGAMLLSRGVCERLGGFDDRYFAYLEDVDLCVRAYAAGFRVVFAPPARVYHKGRAASGGGTAPLIVYYATRNHLMLMHRHGRGGALLRRLRATAVVALNAAYESRVRGGSAGAVPP